MTAHLRKLLTVLGDTFWLLPGATVIVGILAEIGFVAVDRSGVVPQWLIASSWLYNGGATGARTLLGTVASSTTGVAGTVFSITIAALSLAAGQMGPRLLRNEGGKTRFSADMDELRQQRDKQGHIRPEGAVAHQHQQVVRRFRRAEPDLAAGEQPPARYRAWWQRLDARHKVVVRRGDKHEVVLG